MGYLTTHFRGGRPHCAQVRGRSDTQRPKAPTSLQLCGAKGDSKIAKGSNTACLLHFIATTLLVQIIKALTQVLKEISLNALAHLLDISMQTFSSSGVGASVRDVYFIFIIEKSPKTRRRKRNTPSMPLVSQGFDYSRVPKNIS